MLWCLKPSEYQKNSLFPHQVSVILWKFKGAHVMLVRVWLEAESGPKCRTTDGLRGNMNKQTGKKQNVNYMDVAWLNERNRTDYSIERRTNHMANTHVYMSKDHLDMYTESRWPPEFLNRASNWKSQGDELWSINILGVGAERKTTTGDNHHRTYAWFPKELVWSVLIWCLIIAPDICWRTCGWCRGGTLDAKGLCGRVGHKNTVNHRVHFSDRKKWRIKPITHDFDIRSRSCLSQNSWCHPSWSSHFSVRLDV